MMATRSEHKQEDSGVMRWLGAFASLFVGFYEEPTLRKKFGAPYEEYCRNVRRWRPRVRAWQQT